MHKRFLHFLKRWISAVVDIRMMAGLVNLPRYVRQYFKYKNLNSENQVSFLDSYPCLRDSISHTPFDPHYFYQAAWLARRLEKDHPNLHVDVGSSVNMLSVISASQNVVFLDYRPLQTSLDQLICVAGTATNLPFQDAAIYSLSSLHVLEHIGLGRYGDPLDPQGTSIACNEINRVLAPGGRLYISVPVGQERTYFNAHRVFYPETIVDKFDNCRLAEFSFVDDFGVYHKNQNIEKTRNLVYGCGMFEFVKNEN